MFFSYCGNWSELMDYSKCNFQETFTGYHINRAVQMGRLIDAGEGYIVFTRSLISPHERQTPSRKPGRPSTQRLL